MARDNRREPPVVPVAALGTRHPARAANLQEAPVVDPDGFSDMRVHSVTASTDTLGASEVANDVTPASQGASSAAAGSTGPENASNAFLPSEGAFSPLPEVNSSSEPPSALVSNIPQLLSPRAAAVAAAEARAAVAAAAISKSVP